MNKLILAILIMIASSVFGSESCEYSFSGDVMFNVMFVDNGLMNYDDVPGYSSVSVNYKDMTVSLSIGTESTSYRFKEWEGVNVLGIESKGITIMTHDHKLLFQEASNGHEYQLWIQDLNASNNGIMAYFTKAK